MFEPDLLVSPIPGQGEEDTESQLSAADGLLTEKEEGIARLFSLLCRYHFVARL